MRRHFPPAPFSVASGSSISIQPSFFSYFFQEGAQPAPQGQVHFHDNLFPTGSGVFAKPWQRGKWRARAYMMSCKSNGRGHTIGTPPVLS